MKSLTAAIALTAFTASAGLAYAAPKAPAKPQIVKMEMPFCALGQARVSTIILKASALKPVELQILQKEFMASQDTLMTFVRTNFNLKTAPKETMDFNVESTLAGVYRTAVKKISHSFKMSYDLEINNTDAGNCHSAEPEIVSRSPSFIPG
jgi:hypothetical protein